MSHTHWVRRVNIAVSNWSRIPVNLREVTIFSGYDFLTSFDMLDIPQRDHKLIFAINDVGIRDMDPKELVKNAHIFRNLPGNDKGRDFIRRIEFSRGNVDIIFESCIMYPDSSHFSPLGGKEIWVSQDVKHAKGKKRPLDDDA